MTLIEVVGGLALLATLLVGILMAKARFTHQAAIAERRLRAVAAADELLAAWRQNPRELPRAGSGEMIGNGGLTWRTLPVANPPINELGADVIRLDIIDSRAASTANAVLASVEFVVDPTPANPAAAAAIVNATDPGRNNRSRQTGAGTAKKHEKGIHHP